jgi:predicted dipeptidase
MDQALNQKIDAYIAENKEQLLQDIAALVAIDSVEGTPEEGAPFGAGPRAALDKTLELAAGMGLATRNCENYIGYAELAGADPEKYLATICHVDVVPVGNGWSQDPFKMQIRDGWMIGRGVADDKGPMVATLYALKFLKEEGVSLRYPIRAMVGDNEETHMNDVEYYLKNYPAPVFCFTPDAEFPVCNGEKGHFGAELVSPVCNGEIKEFEGGVANNAVPDRASALVETDITKLKNAPNITLEPEGNGVRIRGWGKSGHAAMPEGTVNAIGLVVNYLLDNGLCNDAERAYLEALKKLHASTAGTGLGIDCADGPFGPLTIIGGHLHAGGPDRPDHGQPLPHLHQRREDEGADQGGHRHGCFSGERRGCRALLYRSRYPRHQGLHRDLQRGHRRECHALYHGRRHLCPPLPLCGELWPRARGHGAA